MAAGCLSACRTSLGISRLHSAELQLQHPAGAFARPNPGHTHRLTASVYAGSKHRFSRTLFAGRELGLGTSKANARSTRRRCAVVAKAGARKQKSTTVHDDSWEDAYQNGPQKSTMLDFSAPEAPTRKGAEKAGVQPLDEEWDEWESEAVAFDGGSGRRKGEIAHEITGGAVFRAPGNGGISQSAAARNARVLEEEEEIRRRGAEALDDVDGEGTVDESEWELLSEEEEAAFLNALQNAETPIEVVLEEEEGTEAGEWRPVPDNERELLQEQLEAAEKQPLTIERVLEDGATAPVGGDEAEGLGVLWDGPGPMEIERVGEEGPETLEQAEIERLQRLWDNAEGPADGEGDVTNVEVSGAGLRPDEVPESGEDWEEFSEEQLRRVQQQLNAFQGQFFVDDSDDEESDEDSSDGEILGGLREDVWEGDLDGEMTPEEEAELLREAERDLAQGFGSLEEEDEDSKLVRQLNESSNFGESVRDGNISYDEESSEEEGELLRGTEAELRELSGESEFDMSEDGDWEEEEGEELTEDEALIRLLNQERAAELESSDDEDEESEEDESEDVWVGDLRGQMSAQEEAELLAAAEKELAVLRGSQNGVLENGPGETAEVLEEGPGSDAGEDAVRKKMAESLRAFVDTSSRKRKKKRAGERAVFVGEDVEIMAEGGPFTAADEAKMLKRMEKELSELRKEDKYEDLDEMGREKKKLPMEMRCFDNAKVYVKAGDGGNGCVAFRREKFVAYGGPSGGNGGRGGHVFVEVDQGMNSLQPFRKQIHFRAGRGGHGEGSKCEGPKGDDITIKVPPGTVIKRAREGGEEEGEWLMELVKPGEKQVLIPGGRGGRGNTSFKSSQNKAPVIAENGEEGREMWVELELKLVADVGIVGVPNAGKSTLLSVISAARPKIANYPFTTLVPNLGVVEIDYETIVFADVPGLLEGAHTGHGLGQEFLRHCERSRVLVHMIDGTSPQPVHDFEAICNEMALFNPTLAQKPQIVAFNKMDLPEAQEEWPAFQAAMLERGIEAVAISAVAQENVTTILRQTQALLKEIANPYAFDPFERQERKVKVTVPSNDKGPPIDVFSIEQDPHTRTWTVIGEGLERFTQMTNWEYYEAIKRFQKVLDASGVNQELRRRGVREGDTVELGEMEFSWMDKEDWNTFGDGWTRGTRGSKHWPH